MTTARFSPRFSDLARLALLAGAAIGLPGCVVAPDRDYYEPERAYYEPDRRYYERPTYYAPTAEMYDYVYYPAIGAYYDPRISVYYYFEHDHWTHARSLPSHCRPYLDQHVTVRTPRDRPYADHDRHREHYAPERYRAPHDNRRSTNVTVNNNIWIGAPRTPARAHDRNDADQGNGHRDRDRTPASRERQPERAAPTLWPHETARNRARETDQWRNNDRDRSPATQLQRREYQPPSPPPVKARVVTNAGQPIGQRVAPAAATPDDRKDQARDNRKAKSPGRDNHKKTSQNGRAQAADAPAYVDESGALHAQ